MPVRPGSGPDEAPGRRALDTIDLDELRSKMMRFARLHLGDEHQAEDAVQEALAGALANAGTFRREAALRTWVFAILRHKIADTYRRRGRQIPASDWIEEGGEEETFFTTEGRWRPAAAPTAWSDPEKALESDRFWAVFDACLEALPPRYARLFMMREFIGLSAAEICETLEISTNNLYVTLHRCRLRLRRCLEETWFRREGGP